MKLVIALALIAAVSAKIAHLTCNSCPSANYDPCKALNTANELLILDSQDSCTSFNMQKIACDALLGTHDCKELACFPASATVELENGTTKRMNELIVGDRVRVSATEFSDVFFFTHVEKESRMEYLAIQTASGKSLTISAGHLMGVTAGLVAARKVQIGDNVTLADGSTDKVVKITTSIEKGLYAPHTLTGEIVVDGVLASCFTDYSVPEIQQMLLAPLKMLYQMNGAWWLGTNSDSGVPAWLHNFALAPKN